MPTIEVLPSSHSASAPGWALVPDTGYDPSKVAIQPQSRKRAARASGLGGDSASNITRLANATLKHIQELDRESSRDVQIAMAKGGGGGRKGGGFTPNVRRIMQSQKTFANHLADEEAMLAQEGQQGGRGEVVRVGRAPGLGKRASTAAMSPPAEDERRMNSKSQLTLEPPATQPDPESEHLLKTYIPAAPSEAEMEALTSAPPLSYNQARAAPSVAKPQRFFCEICGYWGSIRCMKCGARVCGLECKGAHEEGRCLRY